jgi:hypothetical protein
MPQKSVRAPKQKRTAALTSVSDLVKTFDRHRQLTLSPQLVRFTRLGSVTDSESITKPEASGRPSVASNLFYRVPIKVKMPLGSIKQVVSELGQAAKDVVGSGLPSGSDSQLFKGSRNSLSAVVQEKTETNLVDFSDNTAGNQTETAGNGTSLDWTEDDATTLLYTESGATDDLPHHLQLQDQVPFTPVFTEEEAAAASANIQGSARQSPRSMEEGPAAPSGNFLATMEFSVTTPATPTTVKARFPQLQARRQLPFSGTAGTPKRKKPSSSTKKGARSAGASLAEDSTSSGDERMVASGVATLGKKGGKAIRDPLAEIDALKEQLKTVQMDLLNRQLETMEVIASVKTDMMQLHNRVQHHQEAHVNLEGVVGHTRTG